MPKAEIEDIVGVSQESFFKAITSYESYPKIVDGFKKISVARQGTGKARITYHFGVLLKTVSYTLDVTEDPVTHSMSWKLVDSDVFSKNEGKWTLNPEGANKTKVKYELEAEFKIAVPEMILNKLLKSTMPMMLKNFEKFAKEA